MHRCWIAIFVLLGACVIDLDYADTSFQCFEGDCPEGFECRDSRCVAIGELEPETFRRRLSVGYAGSELLADFPLLVTLDATRIDYGQAGAGGATLRFTDSAGVVLPHEIETWEADGTSRVWVNVPRLGPEEDGEVLMIWGAGAPTAPPATDTWNNDFVAVWHLDDDPSNDTQNAILDASGAQLHGTSQGAMTAIALEQSPLGTATRFDADDDAIVIGDRPEFELPLYSYTFWIRGDSAPDNESGNGQPIFNADEQFNFSWNHGNPEFAQAAAHNDETGVAPSQIMAPLEGGVWYAVAATYDGSSLRVYLDGAEMQAITIGTPIISAGPMALGNDPAAVRFAGALDEVRISRIPRSAAWIKAVYDSGVDALITFGPLEPL